MIRSDEGTFRARDGTRLFWRSWVPESAKARVMIIHGLGEHCSRYEVLAGGLAGRGFAVFGYDHRGHGRSEGQRGHVSRFDVFVQDLATATLRAREIWPGDVPMGWVAHSMGALISMRYFQEQPGDLPDCAVLSAPWLRTTTPISPLLRRVARVLDRVWPGAPLSNNQADPFRLTRDPAVAEAWVADPLVHPRVSPRLFFEAERAQRLVLERREPFPIPLFFLIPTGDPVVDWKLSEQYATSLGGDTKVLELPGLRHEPFNEIEREEVYAETGTWLEQRLNR